MIRGVSQSQAIAKATLVALAQLAAFGCGSKLDTSAERTPSAGGAAVALALEQGQTPALYSALPPSDPIFAIAHGSIITTDRGVIPPTPEFVREVQLLYLERLRGEANAAVLEELEPIRMQFEQTAGAPREFADRAYLIDWLIERVQPSDSATLKARNEFLAKAVDPTDLAFIQVDVEARRTQRSKYQAECLAEGVPTPPDWLPNDPKNKWQSNGTLKPDFIGGDSVGTVWYYVSSPPEPRGLCMALPRVGNQSGMIELLGVICQGNDKSKACFWDNDGLFELNKQATITDDFEAAEELVYGADVCTDCHRGKTCSSSIPTRPSISIFACSAQDGSSIARPACCKRLAGWSRRSTETGRRTDDPAKVKVSQASRRLRLPVSIAILTVV